jgi:hypothetical protein
VLLDRQTGMGRRAQTDDAGSTPESRDSRAGAGPADGDGRGDRI